MYISKVLLINCSGNEGGSCDINGPMLNPLMVKCMEFRSASDVTGELNGGKSVGKQSKKRNYNRPDTEDKINELKNRNFAMQSKKKIKWCVGMYDQWRANRLLDPYVPIQIKRANLDSLFTFSSGDLEYALCRFIREVKKWMGQISHRILLESW